MKKFKVGFVAIFVVSLSEMAVADITNDGIVSIADLLALFRAYGPC
jgi:hypothetical protein